MTHAEYRASRKRLGNTLRAYGIPFSALYPAYGYKPNDSMLWKAQLDAMSSHIEKLNKEKNGR